MAKNAPMLRGETRATAWERGPSVKQAKWALEGLKAFRDAQTEDR